jgi:RNA polymerase sigma-70 factor (ECF subfamily)
MDLNDSIFARLQEGRRQFLALVEDVRPELHRYCARMTGSVADGEDVVQDALARAYYELSELKELPAMRGWLFRIAHNRALDWLRRYDRRMSDPLEAAEGVADAAFDAAFDPEDALAREQAVHAALSRFLELAPAQRSCVILKDVLGHSLEEIAALLEQSVPAVKAALHRGRARLRALLSAQAPSAQSRPAVSPALAQYAALFNARDWDAVRALLVDDVKLELVSRIKAAGRKQVANYFGNYDKIADWLLVPGWLDGREVLAVQSDPAAAGPAYFVELRLAGGRIAAIRDFRYVPYIMRDAALVPAGAG